MLAVGLFSLALGGGVLGPAWAEGPGSIRGGGRGDVPREELFEQIDEARAERDLLELEVEIARKRFQACLTDLGNTELLVADEDARRSARGDGRREDAPAPVRLMRERLAAAREAFVLKSKQLGRERRRVAALEARAGLPPAPAPSAPPPAAAPARPELSWQDAQRALDLVMKGVERWQREPTPPSVPAPERPLAPEDRPAGDGLAWKDAQRLLDLVRQGIERWRGESPRLPEERSVPEQRPLPPPTPQPELDRDEGSLKDAERLLELFLRGVDRWRGR
jgi:hypothetical protein